MSKPELTWDNVIHLRLPVGRERLIGNYRSALTLILLMLTFYSLVRGIAILSHIGYEAYGQEFEIIPRTLYGSYWIVCYVILIGGLFSKGYFIWRLGLIAVGIGLGGWAALFYNNRGFRVFDAIHAYAAFSLMCFIIAILARDPRPIRNLTEKIMADGLGFDRTGS